MKNRFLKIGVVLLIALSFCGCASSKASVIKAKPKKVATAANIKMDPVPDIKIMGIVRKVYVGEFKNATKYQGAGIIFENALKSKLMEKGFQIAQSKTDADLYFEGTVYRCKYETNVVGIVRSMGRQLAYGKEGKEHSAELALDVLVGSGDSSLQTKIAAQTRTFEQDMASGLNDISIKVSDKLVGTIRKGGK